MIVKEAKKISKIVDELFLYFVKHGHKEVDFNVKFTEEEIKISIIVKELKTEIVEKITERLKDKRELEIEEYGWELMGESDCSNELEMIGLLVDTFEHNRDNDKDVLTFIRKRNK